MDCEIEDCYLEATGKATVELGNGTKRVPACDEHKGERFETPTTYERSRQQRSQQSKRDYYSGQGWDSQDGRFIQ